MISEAVWKTDHLQRPGALMLGRADIDHRGHVYQRHSLAPETMRKVTIEFLLQREVLARYIIKEADLLLRVGGVLEVVIVNSKSHSSYFRSRDQVKYEIAISMQGRYALTVAEPSDEGTFLTLRYVKQQASLPEGDTIDRWTFGIVTNGTKTENVDALVRSIVDQRIPECEILVCGPYVFQPQESAFSLSVLDDVMLGGDIRAPLAAKKNRLIDAARYNNLCILHDRFLLPPNWHRRFRAYGNHFDILCLRTLDRANRRFEVDWMKFCYPLTMTSVRNESLSYDTWDPNVIVQGGVIVGKKSIVGEYRLNETLHWEEMEDIHFSKQAYLNGAFVSVDPENHFVSEAVNHEPATGSGLIYRFRQWIAWRRGLLAGYIKFKLYSRRFARRANGLP